MLLAGPDHGISKVIGNHKEGKYLPITRRRVEEGCAPGGKENVGEHRSPSRRRAKAPNKVRIPDRIRYRK
jgi:hypothetical protein